MRCYCIQNGALKQLEQPKPIPNAEEVLVKVKAFGINRADLLQLEGKYPSPDGSDIPGLEVAGIIEGTAQRVCAIVSSGAYAEYIAVPIGQIISIPDNISFTTAAAIPEAMVTSWLNLYSLGGIKKGMRVLIHGGASGIGSLAVQFALREHCTVFTTASDIKRLSLFENEANCHRLSFEEDFTGYIKRYGGADLIIDILGGKYFASNLKAAAAGCRVIIIAAMNGPALEVNLSSILMKNITIIGSTLRSKSQKDKADLLQDANRHLMPLITSHRATPIIDSVFKFDEVQEALLRLKSRQHIGKIVITL